MKHIYNATSAVIANYKRSATLAKEGSNDETTKQLIAASLYRT